MTQLTEHSLSEIVAQLDRRAISSRELTQAYLDRIDELEPDLHAFLCLDEQGALEQADAADRQRAKDEQTPPLLGVPLAVKDLLAVEGLPCTAGSKILEGFHPPYDATTVARLREAGCIILGKTNTDEFAMGSSTENSAYDVTHNPWNLSRVPGGSSGGSAAAVAARLAPVALGTDTGGSVRQPAGFCGVTGIKPTYGRVSRYGLIAYGSSLDSVGVLGQSAEDVAAIFAVMGGHDPLDATSSDRPMPVIDFHEMEPPLNVRLGIPDEYFQEGLDEEVEAAVRAGVAELEKLGAEIEEISLPYTEYAVPVYYLIAPAEASANLARYDGVRYGPRLEDDTLMEMFRKTRGELFGREVKRRIMLGTYALSAGYQDAYYGKAQKVRTLMQQDFERAFERVDLIAAPVAPTTAFEIGAHRGDPLSMYLEDIYTLPINLAGVPAITFPVGFDLQDLPIGMQLIGPPFQEDVLFSAAHLYQGVTDWHQRQPEVPFRSYGL